MRRKKQSKMISDLNVVPYIDVMFVLLIIFMITAPMITHGVKVDLPKVSNAILSSVRVVFSEKRKMFIRFHLCFSLRKSIIFIRFVR